MPKLLGLAGRPETLGGHAVTDVLALIDAATQPRCQHCRTALDDNGPSQDFCGPDCQHEWADLLATDPWDVYRRDDPTPADLGETPPVRFPRGWRERAMRSSRGGRMQGASATWVEFDEADLLPVPATDEFAALITAVEAGWYQLTVTLGGLAPVVQRMNDAWTALRPLVEQLSAGQPPIDPMERALWLRKHRNTGPAAPVRAPRRIDPRRHR
jgi:hypothetical protein